MDSKNDEENQKTHGISCAKAQFAFADSRRVIAEDVSQDEQKGSDPLFIFTLRDETAKTPRETGTRNPKRPRRT